MATEVKVPELPESVSEATVGEWQKKQGDKVGRDENIVDLETDKVVLEVPSTSAGVLGEIKVSAGDTVKAGDVLAIVEEGDGAAGDDDDEDQQAASEDSAQDTKQSESKSGDDDEDRDEEGDQSADDEGKEPVASPAARKLLEENDVAARDVEASGKDGRITKADVQQAIDKKPKGQAKSKGQGPNREDDAQS